MSINNCNSMIFATILFISLTGSLFLISKSSASVIPLKSKGNLKRKLLSVLNLDHIMAYNSRLDDSSSYRPTSKQKIKNLAILRPFSVHMVSHLSETFEKWQQFPPCQLSHDSLNNNNDEKINTQDSHIQADLFLSYSQSFDSQSIVAEAIQNIETMVQESRRRDPNGWGHCIRRVRTIETRMDPLHDFYLPTEASFNPDWVIGPNTQFVHNMQLIASGEYGVYDAVFVMEGDVIPVKEFWLDTFLQEAEESHFAILGSKYSGDAWDSFRSQLPLALQHHINGNALYNITHPLLHLLLNQLKTELDTPYRAVPYDYRMSQILVEGMTGIKGEIPTQGINKKELPNFTSIFQKWWQMYGDIVDENDNHRSFPVRESNVIANYAGTNLSPKHFQRQEVSLIHGAKFYSEWDTNSQDITLVVSEWDDALATNILKSLDKSKHPFSEAVIMVPNNIDPLNVERLLDVETKINISVHNRDKDYFDLCNAPVETEWFMLTNSYHTLAPSIDLLVRKDENIGRMIPVIPYNSAEYVDCDSMPGCLEIYAMSKQFDPDNTKIVMVDDMIFNTKLRDEFCREWITRYGSHQMKIESLDIEYPLGPLGPTATTYVSYLSKKGILEELYDLSDSSFYGKRSHFHRVLSIQAERNAAAGKSAISMSILHEELSSSSVSHVLPPHKHRILAPTVTPPELEPTVTPPKLVPTATPPKAEPNNSSGNSIGIPYIHITILIIQLLYFIL